MQTLAQPSDPTSSTAPLLYAGFELANAERLRELHRIYSERTDLPRGYQEAALEQIRRILGDTRRQSDGAQTEQTSDHAND